MRKNHNWFFIVGFLTLVLLFFISCGDTFDLEYIGEDSLAIASYDPGGFMTSPVWTLIFESGLVMRLTPYRKMPELRISQQYEIYRASWGNNVYRLYIKEEN